MQTVVYVDVLLTVNFIINYMLLVSSGMLSGRNIKRIKVIFSALVGAVSTLVIFLPAMPSLAMGAYKLAVAFLLVFLAYGWLGPRQYLKDVFVFFTISYLLAGVMMAIWVNFTPNGMLCYNGVVYFDISALALIGTTAVAYVLISLFTRVFHRARDEGELWDVTVTIGDKTAKVAAMVDTGNRLAEPFTGAPVAVCGVTDLLGVLPMKVTELVLSGSLEKAAEMEGIRIIPYSAVGKDGFLVALRPDRMELCCGKERFLVEHAFIGISRKKIGGETWQMLLSSDMIKLKITS